MKESDLPQATYGALAEFERAQQKHPSIAILGIRGVPAQHGGFETFAERLALFLVQRGWHVTVYCQTEGSGSPEIDHWKSVRRVSIPVRAKGALGTAIFDWHSICHAARTGAPVLVLGYNTGILCALPRLARVPTLINMDGIEWKRAKWSLPMRAWFWANERFAARLGHHLIADHPEIERHLSRHTNRSKITMIPYGADGLARSETKQELLSKYSLRPGQYATVIARPEPENSILEIVAAFSAKRRGYELAVLGRYTPDTDLYHRRIMNAASEEVRFLGAIYERDEVAAIRAHSLLYVHGHRVGGTNPSLIEAMGAGCPVLAQNNAFNRWVAGPEACYFDTQEHCAAQLDRILVSPEMRKAMSTASIRRHADHFTWEEVLQNYEHLLSGWQPQTESELGGAHIQVETS